MSRFFTVKIGRNTKPPTEPAISSSELKQSREMIDLHPLARYIRFLREKKKRKKRRGGEGKKNSVNRSRCSASNGGQFDRFEKRARTEYREFRRFEHAFDVILDENGSELIHIIFFVNGAKNGWYCLMKDERNFLMHSGIIKNRNIISRKIFMLL